MASCSEGAWRGWPVVVPTSYEAEFFLLVLFGLVQAGVGSAVFARGACKDFCQRGGGLGCTPSCGRLPRAGERLHRCNQYTRQERRRQPAAGAAETSPNQRLPKAAANQSQPQAQPQPQTTQPTLSRLHASTNAHTHAPRPFLVSPPAPVSIPVLLFVLVGGGRRRGVRAPARVPVCLFATGGAAVVPAMRALRAMRAMRPTLSGRRERREMERKGRKNNDESRAH